MLVIWQPPAAHVSKAENGLNVLFLPLGLMRSPTQCPLQQSVFTSIFSAARILKSEQTIMHACHKTLDSRSAVAVFGVDEVH